MRTYGQREALYKQARKLGVIFINYELHGKPNVTQNGQEIDVEVWDHVLHKPLKISADMVILATAVRPKSDAADLGKLYKVPVDGHGFYLEAHAKLRPVDFSTDGMFVAGLAHRITSYNVCYTKLLRSIEPVDAVIHFAGKKAVGESVAKPLLYYANNLTGTLTLCQIMVEFGFKNIIFSSSATVYGDPASVPIIEDFPLSCTNPYGRTKLMTEEILRDLHVADPEWNVCLLRYFNPVGAHKSGRIGEDPAGIPNNLMPYIARNNFV